MPASEEELQCQQEQHEEYAGLQAIFGEHSCTCDTLTGELKARRLELNLAWALEQYKYTKFQPNPAIIQPCR